MKLSFKPEHIVSEKISDEALLAALKEAFDLRLRRHEIPKTTELQRLLFQVVPMEEVRSLGKENLPFFLDCYASWIILEFLRRKKKITLFHLNLQKMFDFEYLDDIVRQHEQAYVSLMERMGSCGT